MPVLAVRAMPTPRTWSDRVLLGRVIDGEQRAWNELIRRYRSLIYRCILQVTNKRAYWLPFAEIEEIYSTILESLWMNDMRKLRGFDPQRGIRLSSWLGRVCINATYDYLRDRLDKRIYETLDELPEWAETDERTPFDALVEQQRWQELKRVLGAFSARDRRFLELYYGHGLRADAVARAMSISMSTVHTKNHKIRAHLRRTIAPLGAHTSLPNPLADRCFQPAAPP